jgi:alkyl sulfatase BDS1-like metallo-beta-lactamase superfamily hydrolase
MVKRFPLSLFFDVLAVNLDPVKSADLDQRVGIKFTDTGEAYTIHVRRGIAEITPGLKDNLDMLVHADSVKWKEMLAKLKSPVTTLAGFKYPKGNVIEFANFLKNFETQPMQPSFEGKGK